MWTDRASKEEREAQEEFFTNEITGERSTSSKVENKATENPEEHLEEPDELNETEENPLLGGSSIPIKWDDDDDDTPPVVTGNEGNALAKGGVVDIWSWKNFGYLPQYFAVGLLYGGLPATMYGVFLGYLNVPSTVYSTAAIIVTFPWAFKVFIGMTSDCFPIFGLRRKPYIILGWIIASLALLALCLTPLPDPYWCKDADGHYITRSSENSKEAAQPCNKDAENQGGKYAMMMMLVTLGYMIADVAADGLTVEFARREPEEIRGTTQTTIYLVRTMGQVVAVLYIAFFMNSFEYKGSFSWGLSYNTIMGSFMAPTMIMIPVSWLGIHEEPQEAEMPLKDYLQEMYRLLKSKSMFFVIVQQFCTPVISAISTTAGGKVKMYWAGVENLQNQLFSLFGLIIFAIGLALVNKYFLNSSWRMMLLLTTLLLVGVDAIMVYMTIYDVVRNQYFYLGESVLLDIPEAMNFVVGTFVIVEMASEGTEGIVFGLLTTAHNVGTPIGRAIGNQVYQAFTPSLDETENYIDDSYDFRNTVAWSFTLSYAMALLSLVFLFFLPNQKQETQRRNKSWESAPKYAVISLTMVGFGFFYSVVVNFMAMDPDTACLKFAGGKGC